MPNLLLLTVEQWLLVLPLELRLSVVVEVKENYERVKVLLGLAGRRSESTCIQKSI